MSALNVHIILKVVRLVSLLCVFLTTACTSTNVNVIRLQNLPDVQGLNQGYDIGPELSGVVVGYPEEEWKIPREGWVLFVVDIEKDGTLSNIRLIDYNPSLTFVMTVLDCLERSIYKPYEVDGIIKKFNNYHYLMSFRID